MRVYTAGTFDLFHPGHVQLLLRCASLGDEVIVVLNTDEFIEKYKGAKPIIPYSKRKEVLEACRYVYDVIPNVCGENCWETIKKDAEELDDYFIIIGSDWASKDYAKQMGVPKEELELFKSKLIYVPYTEGISTTEIKRRICAQQSQ